MLHKNTPSLVNFKKLHDRITFLTALRLRVSYSVGVLFPVWGGVEINIQMLIIINTYLLSHFVALFQGREFNNNLVNDLCQKLEIKVAMTSAYHPQTNGLTGMPSDTAIYRS